MYSSNFPCRANCIYERSAGVKERLADVIAYIALIIIAVLAVPFIIIAVFILGIWTLADKILESIDGRNTF